MTFLGNQQLLSSTTIGFLCSRTIASKAILPCLDWAVEIAKDENATIMSTFHSPVEREVLNYLLQGKCNIIIVLGRSIYKTLPDELQSAFESDRLLIVSVCNQRGISRQSAQQANQYICDNADSLVFGFISDGSSLADMYKTAEKQKVIICEKD